MKINWLCVLLDVCDFRFDVSRIFSVVFGCLGNNHTMPKLYVRMKCTLNKYPSLFRFDSNWMWRPGIFVDTRCTMHWNAEVPFNWRNMTNYDETTWNYIRYGFFLTRSFLVFFFPFFAVVATLDENTNTHLNLISTHRCNRRYK